MRTDSTAPAPTAPQTDARAWRHRLRWWQEVAFVLTFYMIYSAVRNEFGSAAVSPSTALRNAEAVIDIEQALGLFREKQLQDLFVDWERFMQFWNVFYGTFHFILTIFVLVWLFARFPTRYPQWRNTLAATTALALVGYSLMPLMPPRLLGDCGLYGGCEPGYHFVDSLAEIGGLWSFDSGTMQKLSNQYAAMPSLHFAWSTWCVLALYPTLRGSAVRALLLLYPIATLFAIMVTANHYWIDAVGGVGVLALGFLLGRQLTRLELRWRSPPTGP